LRTTPNRRPGQDSVITAPPTSVESGDGHYREGDVRPSCVHRLQHQPAHISTAQHHRRDEWIELGVFSTLKQIALDAYDRIVGWS